MDASFRPHDAIVALFAVELLWLLTNLYYIRLLAMSWKAPPDAARSICAIVVTVSLIAQVFLGNLAYRDLNELSDNDFKMQLKHRPTTHEPQSSASMPNRLERGTTIQSLVD